MFYSEKLDRKIYTDLMNQIKKVNADWLALRESKQYKIGLVSCEMINDIKNMDITSIKLAVSRWNKGIKVRNTGKKKKVAVNNKKTVSNYFSDKKIAIYTAVFGKYDNVPNPRVTPDNCDFYIFTDSKEHQNSIWRYKEYPKKIEKYSNIEKNRFLKMHPHILFEEYEYSIYVDGNVEIFSDLTEYINLLKKNGPGIGVHEHDVRVCVYDEILAVRKSGKEDKENLDRHERMIRATGMPSNYGLLQCNIIVREHNKPICINLMEAWWKEFSEYTKRDQISLPHILYKHNIATSDVSILGSSVYKNPSFRILRHL